METRDREMRTDIFSLANYVVLASSLAFLIHLFVSI